jgi:hypothetical protein
MQKSIIINGFMCLVLIFPIFCFCWSLFDERARPTELLATVEDKNNASLAAICGDL